MITVAHDKQPSLDGNLYYLIRAKHNGQYLHIYQEVPAHDRNGTACIIKEMRQKLLAQFNALEN